MFYRNKEFNIGDRVYGICLFKKDPVWATIVKVDAGISRDAFLVEYEGCNFVMLLQSLICHECN